MFTKYVAATLAIILLSSGILLYEFATHDPGSTIYHEFIPNENNQLRVSRRRLTEEATPKLTIEEVKTAKIADEETKVKYRRSFLGGLVPKVDRENGGLPLYLKDSASQRDGSELVFFWHIPKASGSTMKNIMNFCFNLKRAEKINGEASMKFMKTNILNMDTHTPDGLQNSFEQNLIDSNEIDVLVSNYFLAGSALFTPNHHGRTFTIMRHPIDLAQSLFHYRQTASWERSYRQKWRTWNFEGYVKSEYYMSNWMVRQLTGTMPNEILNETHLEQAKEVVRTKIFVGISTQLEETMRQLKLYYGWEEQKPFCAFNFINAPTNANQHPKLKRGGEVWSAVAEIEKWDLALYYYSLELFSGQRERFPPPTSVEESVIGVAPVVVEPKNGQNSRNMLHVISK